MAWWLTVFFLVGGEWVPGEQFSGWASRPYPTYDVCEERRAFAMENNRADAYPYSAVWVCTAGRPATRLNRMARMARIG
jgi:hypothetical protein